MEYCFEKPVGTKCFENFSNFRKIQSDTYRALFHSNFALLQLFFIKSSSCRGIANADLNQTILPFPLATK